MVWREGKEVEQEVGNQNLSGYRTREVGGTVVKKKKMFDRLQREDDI